MIYADNAATSFFKPETIIEAIGDYLKHPGNPNRGTNMISMDASRIVLDTRIKLADFFDCDYRHVIFTGGITESLNTVIQGLIEKNDHVITTYMEHNSVLRPLYRMGCEMTVCDGTLLEIEKSVKKNTKAVIMNHVSNVTGDINDIRSIGKFCREKGIIFVVDSAQSAGVLPLSMKEDAIDILCSTGHKGLLGMHGIGGLCINGDIKIKPLKVGGTGFDSFNKEHPVRYPSALEAGTLNVPGIISLNKSLDYINSKGLKEIFNHEKALGDEFYNIISKSDKITIYRNETKEHVGIVSINITGLDAGYVSDRLSYDYGIATRSGAHCAPLVHEHYNTKSMVRFSFGLNNTMDDVTECARAVFEILEERKN